MASSSLPRLESSFDWIQGRRWEMEDSHIVADNAFDFWEELAEEHGEEEEKATARQVEKDLKEKFSRVSLYAVFDGHGGNLSADLAEERYTQALLQHEGFKEGKIVDAMTGAFADVDKLILNVDEKKARQSGATALCAVMTDNKLYVANLGDSEGILCKTANKQLTSRVIELTYPHKATNKDEQKRILDAGGRIIQKRVCGSLAVTRGLGDYDFKIPFVPKGHQDYVSRVPYFSEMEVDADCEFMVLACDGLWDVVSHKRAAEIVDKVRRKGRSAQEACEALITESLDRETTDNVSVVVVFFHWD